jgi:hypothetical protein
MKRLFSWCGACGEDVLDEVERLGIERKIEDAFRSLVAAGYDPKDCECLIMDMVASIGAAARTKMSAERSGLGR